MSSSEKREVVKRVTSLVSVVLFLLIATFYFYLPKRTMLTRAYTYADNRPSLSITDLTDGIRLTDTYPITDEEGSSGSPYRFEVENHSDKVINYQIKFNNNIDKILAKGLKVLPNRYLRYTLTSDDKTVGPLNLTDDGVLATVSIQPFEKKVFSFLVWLDYDADNEAQDKSFCGNINLNEITDDDYQNIVKLAQ